MLKIRLALNNNLKKFGGNIGYSIRPTERKKGYNKINLYLALRRCRELNLKDVILDCHKDTLGSIKTIQAFGGKLNREFYYKEHNCMVQEYTINVNSAIEKNKTLYDKFVSDEEEL